MCFFFLTEIARKFIKWLIHMCVMTHTYVTDSLIYIYVYICIYTYIHIFEYVYICIHIYTYIYIYIYIYAYTCVYVCEYVYVHIHVYIYIYMFTHIYIYILTHTSIYIYTHTSLFLFQQGLRENWWNMPSALQRSNWALVNCCSKLTLKMTPRLRCTGVVLLQCVVM